MEEAEEDDDDDGDDDDEEGDEQEDEEEAAAEGEREALLCSQCIETFSTEAELKAHEEKHHSARPTQPKPSSRVSTIKYLCT